MIHKLKEEKKKKILVAVVFVMVTIVVVVFFVVGFAVVVVVAVALPWFSSLSSSDKKSHFRTVQNPGNGTNIGMTMSKNTINTFINQGSFVCVQVSSMPFFPHKNAYSFCI